MQTGGRSVCVGCTHPGHEARQWRCARRKECFGDECLVNVLTAVINPLDGVAYHLMLRHASIPKDMHVQEQAKPFTRNSLASGEFQRLIDLTLHPFDFCSIRLSLQHA